MYYLGLVLVTIGRNYLDYQDSLVPSYDRTNQIYHRSYYYDRFLPSVDRTGTQVPISRSNSQNSDILPYSYIFEKYKFVQILRILRYSEDSVGSANSAEFRSGYRLKSTLKVAIHFTPLRGVSDKKVHVSWSHYCMILLR